MAEYIEREAAIAALIEFRGDQTVSKYATVMQYKSARDAISRATKVLESLPAADVEPVRHGRWEWFEEWNPSTPDHPRECEDCGWRCGKCKTALEDVVGGYWDNPDEEPKLRYCPNCGAMMEGGHDG